MSKGMGGHQSAAMVTDHWLTPPEIVRALGKFDLDPCFSEPRPWATATTMWGLPTDGLAEQWFGRVWLNPPYGRRAGKWLRRLAMHGNGIALVMARTETKVWFDHIWPKADLVLFMRTPRLHFYRGDGTRAPHNCGAPTALIAYGVGNALHLSMSGVAGQKVMLTPQNNAQKSTRQPVSSTQHDEYRTRYAADMLKQYGA